MYGAKLLLGAGVPAPATAELLKGIPLAPSIVEAELTTPTGAAILATVVDEFGPLPPLTLRTIGYGAGDKDFPEQPNVLRLLVGEAGDGGLVAVAVRDTGEGIPADDLPRVFTKFFRRDHGRPNGTGLGLWISRGLVEAHGGELTAESDLGRGSTFRFTLPIDPPAELLDPEPIGEA